MVVIDRLKACQSAILALSRKGIDSYKVHSSEAFDCYRPPTFELGSGPTDILCPAIPSKNRDPLSSQHPQLSLNFDFF